LIRSSYSPIILEGSSVAVFGCGAIGLGVINTSVLVGASRIIAVDTNPGKESWAKKFGATDFINPTTLPEGKKIQDHLIEITDGGLDYTFDCTGNVCVVVPLSAVSSISFQRSMLCERLLKPATRAGASLPSSALQLPGKKFPLGRKSNFRDFRCHLSHVNSFQLVTGRTWRGTAFGGVKGRTEIPGLVEGDTSTNFVCLYLI